MSDLFGLDRGLGGVEGGRASAVSWAYSFLMISDMKGPLFRLAEDATVEVYVEPDESVDRFWSAFGGVQSRADEWCRAQGRVLIKAPASGGFRAVTNGSTA